VSFRGQKPTPRTDQGTQEVKDDEVIQGLLNRRILAAYRHRVVVAQRLGMTESEVTALTYLAQRPLTPAQLGERLLLTSGGVTALLHRLKRAGHITRERHPNDKRSVVVHADPAIVAEAARSYARVIDATRVVIGSLSDDERDVVGRFLHDVAKASEESVEALVAEAQDGDAPPEKEATPIWA
jgi:DNA-binding MarR family transcriptional regulator